jgi:anti-anti-sigma factor
LGQTAQRGEQPLAPLERHSGVSHDTVEQPVDIMSDGPVLVLSGDLDVRSTMQVRTAVQELLGCYDEIAIDLSGVESADVTALKVLAAATVQAIRDGHHLTLRHPSAAVRRMLHLSHLARVVEVTPAPATDVG